MEDSADSRRCCHPNFMSKPVQDDLNQSANFVCNLTVLHAGSDLFREQQGWNYNIWISG
jgi:hypothetical protein